MQKSKEISIDQFSTDAITIYIPSMIPSDSRCIADLRLFKMHRTLPNLPRMDLIPSIMQLYEHKCDYIDIGCHADWIAAEIPLSNASYAGLDVIAQILLQIKKQVLH